ncbi:MAG: hypothetical protein QG637_280, partial [Chloroflexota bacterium]|nr:hypothetical protein [Chloroflexota bacterium]
AALSGDLLSSVRIGPELNLDGAGGILRGNALDIDGWARALRLLGGELMLATALTSIVAAGFLTAILCAKAGLIDAIHTPSRQEPRDVGAALRRGARFFVPILAVTLLLYVPYLLVSDLAGELLRLSPGLLRLPIYLVLLVLLAAGVGLALLHPLAMCGIVFKGLKPRASIEGGWRLIRRHTHDMIVIGGVLLAVWLALEIAAKLILSPVAGVSLLSALLGWSREALTAVGQGLGLTLLGILATAIRAPAQALGLVVVALAYQKWDSENA